ncbi:MAG: J domain-containing protein [Spirochaetia bacterium]
MDSIFNRLNNLFRSFSNDIFEDFAEPSSQSGADSFQDPDMADAWDELNDYLNRDSNSGSSQQSRHEYSYQKSYQRTTGASGPPQELAQDYKNLEVSFGTNFDEVRKSYKVLIRKYHPDRFSNDPDRLKAATEIAKKINYSFQRIKQYHETGKI